MKIISCASYYGSGSSAITDLISEYNNVFSLSTEEFRFVQDPDGISDLEYNLVENFNRHNSGRALKRYKRLVDFYAGNFFTKKYEKYFKGNWKKESYKYIDALTDFKYHGAWMYDSLDKGIWFYYLTLVPTKILRATIWHNKPERFFNVMHNEVTYCSHPTKEKFISLTREYIDNLFKDISNGSEKVMVDQIVPSTNLSRYIRYFNDIQVIIVDRDPRDVFCLEKYVWRDGMIPTDPELFCEWFKYTRSGRKKELENTNVNFVQFEDLIFHYDETVRSIEKWLNLSSQDHSKAKRIFNPNVSQKNTRTWEKYECNSDEIKYIEKELKEYLYKYN